MEVQEDLKKAGVKIDITPSSHFVTHEQVNAQKEIQVKNVDGDADKLTKDVGDMLGITRKSNG